VAYFVEDVVVDVVEYFVGHLACCRLLSSCFVVVVWLLFGCLLFAVASVLLRMLFAVAYVLEYSVEYCVEYCMLYLTTCWLFSGCVLVVCSLM
jgi:hypothetical protein